MLELFYITNDPDIALAAQNSGIDRIFIDMEYIGKAERQGGMDTVQNHHTVEDVRKVRAVIDRAELLVRVNPIHAFSRDEIDDVINAGADVVMLPMWRSADEVKAFIDYVGGRATTLLLLETSEAEECIDKVTMIDGIDEIYIGLNDLHLSQGKKFMFELYTDGTVDRIVNVLKASNIKFGIGGVGKVNTNNLLPAENILCEHYRLGSSMVILARAFCDWTKYSPDEFERIMSDGIKENRKYEKMLEDKPLSFFDEKHRETATIIRQITEQK